MIIKNKFHDNIFISKIINYKIYEEAFKLNILKFLGFDSDEDDYDDNNEYEERARKNKNSRRDNLKTNSNLGSNNSGGRLILFKGVASDSDKKRLRQAFNDGAMILIDLHELNRSEFDESGKDFITFMGGVAYAREGEIKFIEPAQYLVTPRAGMFEIWPEGDPRE